jgi:hypothetical protein
VGEAFFEPIRGGTLPPSGTKLLNDVVRFSPSETNLAAVA